MLQFQRYVNFINVFLKFRKASEGIQRLASYFNLLDPLTLGSRYRTVLVNGPYQLMGQNGT